jgi:hypothetical protein
MSAHERLLRQECGYTGTQPYWDEERDAGKFSSSEVFDPELGFGEGSGGCIKDGPFKDYVVGNIESPGCGITTNDGNSCITAQAITTRNIVLRARSQMRSRSRAVLRR